MHMLLALSDLLFIEAMFLQLLPIIAPYRYNFSEVATGAIPLIGSIGFGSTKNR